MHKEILSSVFNYSLESDFQKSVMAESAAVNMQGVVVRTYSKKFNDPFHLFDTITVKDFGELCNISLQGKFTLFKMYYCRKLVNRLYKIYGPDTFGHNKYCVLDWQLLNDKEIGFFCREWPAKLNQNQCSFTVDKTEKSIDLILFGSEIAHEEREMWPVSGFFPAY